VIAKESYRKLRKSSTFAIRQAAARLSPSGCTTFQTTFSPVSFGKSFMQIRSAVPENGCLIVLVDGKNTQKNKKKTYAKHIRICLLPEGGCVNNKNNVGGAWGLVPGSKKEPNFKAYKYDTVSQ